MGAVGVRGIPRQGQQHHHRPAKSKPKSPFRFRSRGPPGLPGLSPPRSLGQGAPPDAAAPGDPPATACSPPHGPPGVRHAPAPGAGHQPPAQRRQPRSGAPTGPGLRGPGGGLVPLVPGVRGTVNEPRTWGLLPPRGRVAGLPTHLPHLSAARLSTRFPQRLRGFTAWQRVRGGVLPPKAWCGFLPPNARGDYVWSVLLPTTMLLALSLGGAGVGLSSLRIYQ